MMIPIGRNRSPAFLERDTRLAVTSTTRPVLNFVKDRFSGKTAIIPRCLTSIHPLIGRCDSRLFGTQDDVWRFWGL